MWLPLRALSITQRRLSHPLIVALYMMIYTQIPAPHMPTSWTPTTGGAIERKAVVCVGLCLASVRN